LIRFLDDGGIEIDSNSIVRSIRNRGKTPGADDERPPLGAAAALPFAAFRAGCLRHLLHAAGLELRASFQALGNILRHDYARIAHDVL
jgi:hypothetical protein